MIERYEHGSITWIDVSNPETTEIRGLMDEFDLRPTIAEELLSPSIRPKAEVYNDDLLYLVLHFPALRHTNTQKKDQEVDFILTKNVLITVRYDTIDALHKFSKLFEVEALLARDEHPHAGHVFFAMIMKLYRSIGHELEFIHDQLEEVEEQIFQGKEREMVMELSSISRDLLNIKQAITVHQTILETFKMGAMKLYGESFKDEFSAIESEYYRITTLRSMNTDSLWELRKTNDSLLTTKQNEIMKVLTILAFVTFPLTLVAGVFGMNTKTTPIVGHTGDFWQIIILMLSATLVMIAYFKYKKWL